MSIEAYDDLDLQPKDSIETIDAKLQEKLGVKLIDLQQRLCDYIQSHAEEMSHQFKNIAPMKDYGKLIEEREGIEEWLKSGVIKPEHWNLYWIYPHATYKKMLQVIFHCDVIDDGETCKGHCLVGFSGAVRHVFAQGDDCA